MRINTEPFLHFSGYCPIRAGCLLFILLQFRLRTILFHFSGIMDTGCHKRSEILGEISAHTDTLAVAGTHGKTTVSTMIAHLLKQSHVDCSAFLGGISKNYNSNLLIGESRYTVMEADEFDRSFHRLNPLMAVVTSVDADHLDIYGDHETMIEAYNEFCCKDKKGRQTVC